MLKRVNLIILFFGLCGISFTAIEQNQEMNLTNRYKTLNWQLLHAVSVNYNINSLKEKLNGYLSTTNKDIANGLKLILFEEQYEKYALADKAQLKMDGIFNDWKYILFSIHDQTNDVELPEADLITFKARLDSEKNLYVYFETKNIPSRLPADKQTFSVHIRFPENPDYLMGVDLSTISNAFCHYQTYNKKTRLAGEWKKIKFVSSLMKNRMEAKIPLSAILTNENIEMKNEIEVSASLFHKKLKKQRDFLNRYITLSYQKRNYALELLIRLLSEDMFIPHDAITLAMVLANNDYYKKFDALTRERIIIDIKKHIDFYKETIALQKRLNLPFSLQNTGLSNKIIWSFRDARPGQLINWNLNDYNVFVDKIENLRYMQNLMVQNAHLTGADFSYKKIGDFVAHKTEYASTIEMIWLWHGDRNDKKRYTTEELVKKLKQRNLPNWCKNVIADFENNNYFVRINGHRIFNPQRDWLNAQIEIFKTQRKFRGGCGVSAILEKSFYKSLGIPSYQKYFYSIDPNFIFDHMFTLFFNYEKGIWQSLYLNNFQGKLGKNPEIQTVNYSILFHHELKVPQVIIENMTAVELDNVLKNGIHPEYIEKNILTYQYFRTLNKSIFSQTKYSIWKILHGQRQDFGLVDNVMDGDSRTIWQYKMNHLSGTDLSIIFDFNNILTLMSFSYLPRQDKSDLGMVKGYSIYSSKDGNHFEIIASGNFNKTKSIQVVPFKKIIKARYIQLKVHSEIMGRKSVSIAELDFYNN